MNSILLAIVLTAAAPAFEVQTLDGRTLVGPLVELTTDHVIVAAPGGRVSLEAEKLLSISAKQKPAAHTSGIAVELIDGSAILASQYVAHGTAARITLPEGKVVSAPTGIVRTVRLQHESGLMADEWNRLIGLNADADLLVVHRDDVIDYHKGVLHDVTADTVQFELDGELLPVKRSKIYGIAYRHGAAAKPAPAVCQITDLFGSRWSARSLGLSDKLQWTTPAGLAMSEPPEKIAQIDFSGGKIVYLSDLKPEDVRWTSYFGAARRLPALEQFYAPRYDRNFDSSPLQLGGVQYRKGLALHSRTRVVYRLPERFSRLRAVAGIDDAVRPGGNVRLTVRGDDKDLLDTVIVGAKPPRPIDLDLTGVRRLTILVDFGDTLSPGDYLLLCDARLSK
jgi:hypothetical protein